ncbi:alpha-mannosidase MNS [Salix suchowensis]|nr:alpha-mannosidase MNS [Salix suchowensis]
MLVYRFRTWVLLLLVIFPDPSLSHFDSAKKKQMREKHDELKPLSRSFTDSLSELGNLKLEHLPQNYNGTALTFIESLSSLVILGNCTEFERAVLWLSENLTFDVDARVNLFEVLISLPHLFYCVVQVLGGLVSAHILATDSTNRLVQGSYKNQLLVLAEDFLPAFDTPTGLPYYGVMKNETTETSTSGCGSLILEMGALSRLTGDPRYESAALRTTLDMETGEWIEHSSGIGAGVDSFYEYLFKAHILFGKEDLWRMFHSAYLAVQKYFRHGHGTALRDSKALRLDHEADMRTGKATYWQLTSLQAFWPGLQVLVGDIAAANTSHCEFVYVWKKFGVLPERYLLDHQMLHPTEKYYPLRPELAESTFYLYQATKDPWYMEVGETIVNSLNSYTKVEGGFASIRDVTTMQTEDHMHSFFLAETCKYLYLLFDDSFLVDWNHIFTTEGHPLPVLSAWQDRLPEIYIPSNWTYVKCNVSASLACIDAGHGEQLAESACHVPDAQSDHKCFGDEECGVDSTSCRRRSCSMAGYCGLWLVV